MTDTSTSKAATKSPQGLIARFLSDTEIDTRLLGMLGALALIWGGISSLWCDLQ
jgi:D-xylose transport system permease protein